MSEEKQQRDTIFIGHANPEDDEFTLWIHAKLKNEGYNVECDKTCLTGGEDDYWKVLQDILDNRACKYLLVLSKDTFKKPGVIDEWEHAKGVAKRTGIKDFIIILKIDDVAFDVRIGVNVKNHFRFDRSWATALKRLVFKLNQDRIPRKKGSPLSIDDWLRNRYSTASGLAKKTLKYYSNWVPISGIPQRYFAYQYANPTQAQAMLEEVETYPIVRHDKYLITFLEDLPAFSHQHQVEIPFSDRVTIDTESVFKRDESEQFPVYNDRRRFLVRLLNNALEKTLTSNDLTIHEMSRGRKCFHYQEGQIEGNKVGFEYEGQSTWKLLIGDFFESQWHYGVSFTTLLYPSLCYSLRAHLLFSDDGRTIWKSKKKLFRARRTKGKKFFNEDWRMLMLAFLQSVAHEGNEIDIPLAEVSSIKLTTTTLLFESQWDYDEPREHARIIPLEEEGVGLLDADEEDSDEDDENETV